MIHKFDDVRRCVSSSVNYEKTVQTPSVDILKTMTFNEKTLWTDATVPYELMEYGKVPPLGVRDLQKQGIIGDGVNVAIIDQPLALDHPEYKGKIVEYKTFTPEGYDIGISSMHGPAVSSLLVGRNLGVAPGAKVYYAAVPCWLGDAQYEAQALRWIINVNKTLSEKEKIKFVSVSAAPGDCQVRSKNARKWIKAVEEAEKSGICVVECTEGKRFVTAGYFDYQERNFVYGFPHLLMKAAQKGEVHVPNSQRTVAESYDNKYFGYAFNGVGGLSWGIPYSVGVLCMGQQVNPNLSAFELRDLLIESAQKNDCIINPADFINRVKNIDAYADI